MSWVRKHVLRASHKHDTKMHYKPVTGLITP